VGTIMYLFCGLLAVLGRFLGQRLGARWSADNSRRELRVGVLIDAWRRLERAASDPGPEEMRGFVQALADLQLLGTPAQADLAARVARSMRELGGKAPPVDDLLEALRIEVRGEMRLAPAKTGIARSRDASGDVLQSQPSFNAHLSDAARHSGLATARHRRTLAQDSRKPRPVATN
jgi:hypothetical protein